MHHDKRLATRGGLIVCLVMIVSLMFQHLESDPSRLSNASLLTMVVIPLLGTIGTVYFAKRLLRERSRTDRSAAEKLKLGLPADVIERSGWPSVSCLASDSPYQYTDLPADLSATQPASSIRKVVFGIVWCVLFYVGGCILTGLVIGVFVVMNQPNSQTLSSEAAKEAYRPKGETFVPLISAVAVTLSIAGSACGVLPGTRSRRPRLDQRALSNCG